MIELVHGDWRLDVAPHLGGSIARLRWRDIDVLRPIPAGSHDALESGCFPLVPYANRIANGRFAFGGRDVELPALPAFAPHALHGDGWQKLWDVVDSDDGLIRLIYRHPADAWPWAYEAKQTFEVVGDRLRVELLLTNSSDEPLPAGLGLHPYFPVTGDTRLTLRAAEVWALGEDDIPTTLEPVGNVFDWSDGPHITEAPFVDHCYSGWDGRAEITGARIKTTVTASANAGWAHVFAPGGAFCCIEPVTHRPDAVHAPTDEDSGLTVLAPGETLSMWMEIAVSPA